jgi:hypothetical protein
MSAGRILWICWCLGWTAAWTALAGSQVPHRVCTETMLIITSGQSCARWGSSGNWGLALLLGLLAALSLAATQARLHDRPPQRPPHC